MTEINTSRTVREGFRKGSETPKSGKSPHLHLHLHQQLHQAPSTHHTATHQHQAPEAPQALLSGCVNLPTHVTATGLRRKAAQSVSERARRTEINA